MVCVSLCMAAHPLHVYESCTVTLVRFSLVGRKQEVIFYHVCEILMKY